MNDDSKKNESATNTGVTRRGFLATVGVGAVAVAAGGKAAAQPTEEILKADDVSKVTLSINGQTHKILVEPRWSLLFVLREKLGLTATKIGCERGECGACTVLINNEPRYACMTLAVEAEGSEITTLEGLLDGEKLGPVQQAFAEHDAFQCGYCTSGQIMAVEGLLRHDSNPSPERVREGVSGNMCRCGAYPHIFKAAHRASELKGGGGGRS